MIWALHGMMGSSGDWTDLREAGLEVCGVDLWEQVAVFEEWAKKFCDSVEASEDQEAILLGYSLGGRLGLHALLERPGLWKGAVIVSAHPGLCGEDEREERWGRDMEWARRLRQDAVEYVVADWEGQGVLQGGAKQREVAVVSRWRASMARGMELWSLGRQADLRGRLGEIMCPVLWVTGSRDERYCGLAEEAMGFLPRGEHLVVAGAGHRVPSEKPDPFSEAVTAFQVRCLG